MHPTIRRSYVIRMWQEAVQQENQPVSRFILENTSTGERQGFTAVEPLLQVLKRALQETAVNTGGDYPRK